MDPNRLKGIIMVVIGACLWGLSGAAAQQLFNLNMFLLNGWLQSDYLYLALSCSLFHHSEQIKRNIRYMETQI